MGLLLLAQPRGRGLLARYAVECGQVEDAVDIGLLGGAGSHPVGQELLKVPASGSTVNTMFFSERWMTSAAIGSVAGVHGTSR